MKHRKLKVTELNRLTVEAYKKSQKTPLIVVLDHVRSAHNVGAVFRTADAFRMEAVYLCGITSTPPDTEIHKTALGAEDTVAWQYYEETVASVQELKNQGYILCALEQTEGSVALADFIPDKAQKYAIIVGHEVKGVQQNVLDLCDVCLEIPQFGVKHSLNVSVAVGIVLWDFFRKLG